MTCPSCGSVPNRLVGRDGWQVVPVMDAGRIVEVRRPAVVLACPSCEWCGTKDQAVASE